MNKHISRALMLAAPIVLIGTIMLDDYLYNLPAVEPTTLEKFDQCIDARKRDVYTDMDVWIMLQECQILTGLEEIPEEYYP